MAKLDDFKTFVRSNPRLINHVKNGSMTWQKFYEMYDLYGPEDASWRDYTEEIGSVAAPAGFLSFLKNIDLDGVQNGVNSIQRVVGVLQDLSGKGSSTPKTDYKPRPVYRPFDE